jgi:hypothetical protein
MASGLRLFARGDVRAQQARGFAGGQQPSVYDHHVSWCMCRRAVVQGCGAVVDVPVASAERPVIALLGTASRLGWVVGDEHRHVG